MSVVTNAVIIAFIIIASAAVIAVFMLLGLMSYVGFSAVCKMISKNRKVRKCESSPSSQQSEQ